MRITNPIEYIILGGRIRYLNSINGGEVFSGQGFALENMKEIRVCLEKLGFRVSLNLYNARLLAVEKELTKITKSEDNHDGSCELSQDQFEKLNKGVMILENTIFAEAKEHKIASPVPRRFALDHLLNEPESVLGSGVFVSLTDIGKYDFSSACKCLAFESPTAASFHVLRCAEESVRTLYCAYFPRGDSARPWGALTNELEGKSRKPKPDEVILELLNTLRRRFRNPTNHPDMIYEIEEAEDLVHVVVDVINRIARDPKVTS